MSMGKNGPTRREAALNMATWNNYIYPQMGFSSSLLNQLAREGLLVRMKVVGSRRVIFRAAKKEASNEISMA